MVPTSFFGQVIKLGKLLISSPIYLGLFIIFILLFCFQFLNVKRNNSWVKILVSVLFLGLMLFAILGYHTSIMTGLDYMLERMILNLYFPSFAIYMMIIAFSYCVFVFTMFSKRYTTVVKKINIVFFTLIQFLFSVFLINVITNDIDISSRIAMYQSTDMTIILQVSMILFLFWLLALVIGYYIKLLRKYFFKKEEK